MLSKTLSKTISAGDAIGVRNLVDINTALGICISTMTIGTQITNWFRAKNTDDANFHKVQQERESASQLYNAANNAFQAKQYGEALHLIDLAIKDLTHSQKQEKDSLIELEGSKLIYAEIYRFKGIVLFYDEKYEAALDALSLSLTYLEKQVLVLNLIAFIYINYLPTQHDKAISYLNKSIAIDREQIYANLYLALKNRELVRANRLIKEFEQIAAARQGMDVQQLSNKTEIKNMAASMLEEFLPYMLAAWLELNTEILSDPDKLAHIAAICYELVDKFQSMQWKRYHERLLESKIRIFTKLSNIKSFGKAISDQDKNWIKGYSFSLPLEGDTKFFYPCLQRLVDRSITKYFPEGLNTTFLKLDSMRHEMAKIIIGWARSSYFYDDQHPEIIELKQLCKAERKGANNEKAIKDKASSFSLIEHFIDTYITDKGLTPWLRYIHDDECKPSILYLLCAEKSIEISVYKIIDKENSIIQLIPKHGLQFVETDPKGKINLLLQGNEFTIMHGLDRGPAKLYRLIAISTAHDLIEKDPNNRLAWHTLSEAGTQMTQTWQRPYSLNPALPCSPRLFQNEAINYLININSHCKARGKPENQHETAKMRLLTVLSHLQQAPISQFNIKESLANLYYMNIQPYSEIASVLHIRLILQGFYKQNKAIHKTFLDQVIIQFTNLNQYESRLLADLVWAEFELRGDRRQKTIALVHRPHMNLSDNTHLIRYLRSTNIIENSTEIVQPQDFDNYIEKGGETILLDFCHGFAAYLLSLTCNNKNNFEAYQRICIKLGYQKDPENLNELYCQIMGLPLETRLSNYRLKEDIFNRYKSEIAFELQSILSRSRLMAPFSVIEDYAVTKVISSTYHLIPKWFHKLQKYIANKSMHKLYRVLLVIENSNNINFDFRPQDFDFSKYAQHEKYRLLNDLYYLRSERRAYHPRFYSIQQIEEFLEPPQQRIRAVKR